MRSSYELVKKVFSSHNYNLDGKHRTDTIQLLFAVDSMQILILHADLEEEFHRNSESRAVFNDIEGYEPMEASILDLVRFIRDHDPSFY